MKKKLFAVLISVIYVSVLISGCGKDDKQTSGILVEDINGNTVNSDDEDSTVEVASIGPDGETVDEDATVEVILDEATEGDTYVGPLPGDDEDIVEGPSSPEEEARENGTSTDGVISEGPGGDSVSPDGSPISEEPPLSPADDTDFIEDPGDPFDAPVIDENAPVTAPEGAVVTEGPSFSATSVSGSSVVAKIGGYISLGAGDQAPDGSVIWSGTSGSYSADIQANEAGNVYAAFFTSNGDKAFLAACAGAFSSGAQAFVNSNDTGEYEDGEIVFELEAKGGEMCSLRVTSKSYQSVLGSPM